MLKNKNKNIKIINKKKSVQKKYTPDRSKNATPMKIRKSKSIHIPKNINLNNFNGSITPDTSAIIKDSFNNNESNLIINKDSSNSRSIKINIQNKMKNNIHVDSSSSNNILNSSSSNLNSFVNNSHNSKLIPPPEIILVTSSNVNAFSAVKSLNKKIFNIEDSNLENLKTHYGPTDFSCIINNCEISRIIEKTNEVLVKRKIVFIQTTPYRFRCSKNGISFDIEIYKLEDLDLNCYYFKYRLKQGDNTSFRKLANLILNDINSKK